MIKLENLITCDFETDKIPKVCSWGCWSNEKYIAGVGLDSFMKWLRTIQKNTYIFFHNGSNWDFHFILPKLSDYGYTPYFKHSKKERIVYKTSDYKEENISLGKIEENQYEYLTNENSKIFQMRIGLKPIKGKAQTIIFRDSALLIPQKLSKYGETLNKYYNTDRFTKLEEDYSNIKTYETLEEFEKDTNSYNYLKRDCEILFEMLKVIDKYLPFNKWKMTAAGTAYNEWRKSFTLKIIRESEEWTEYIPERSKGEFVLYIHSSNPNKKYNLAKAADKILSEWFPLDWQDYFNIKTYYYGGLTHLNPSYKGIHLKEDLEVSSFDINSSYPYSLISTMIPFGHPSKKSTKKSWNLYEVKAKTNLVNENGLPFIPRETGTAYIYDRVIKKGSKIYLTSTELPNFKKYYNGKFEAKVSLAFECKKGEFFFGDYVKEYSQKKIEAGRTKDKVLETVSKMFLNSLYGKFGSNTQIISKIYNPNTKIMETEDILFQAAFFMPVAIATTASSRMLLVDAVGNNYKHFVYSDTDSIYCISKYLTNFNFNIDLFELGKWKQETHKYQAIFRRAKQYVIWKEDGAKNNVKIAYAGLQFPKEYNFKLEDFILGKKIWKQKKKKRVVGLGLILEDIEKDIIPIWEYVTDGSDWFYVKKEKMSKKEHFQRQQLDFFNKYDNQIETLKNLI